MNTTHQQTQAENTAGAGEEYHLHLFVAGSGADSSQARDNITQLCTSHLQDKYRLEVTDVSENPMEALAHNVIVTPMLILVAPPPRVTILGNLYDTDKVLAALRLSRIEM
jgi:circadian clock protein KaiB